MLAPPQENNKPVRKCDDITLSLVDVWTSSLWVEPAGFALTIFYGVFWRYLYSEKCLDIQCFMNFAAAHFVTIRHAVNSSPMSNLWRMCLSKHSFSYYQRLYVKIGTMISKLTDSQCLKAPVSSRQSGKARPELHFLYQTFSLSRCSVFHHTWIPSESTWISSPAAMCFPYLQRTLTWISGGT